MNTIINITIRKLINRYAYMYSFEKPDYQNTLRIDDVIKDLEIILSMLEQEKKRQIYNN